MNEQYYANPDEQEGGEPQHYQDQGQWQQAGQWPTEQQWPAEQWPVPPYADDQDWQEAGYMQPEAGYMQPGYDGQPEYAEPAPKRRIRWIPWLISCAVVGVILGGVIAGVLKFVNGPVTAKAIGDPLEKAREAAAPTPAANKLSGHDVEMSYPSLFDQESTHRKDANASDEYYFTGSGGSRTMSVSVDQFNIAKLDGDPSFKLRLLHPETYKLTNIKIANEPAVLASKLDNTELTLFWLHKTKELSVAMTTNNPRDSLSDFMQTITTTVRWKN